MRIGRGDRHFIRKMKMIVQDGEAMGKEGEINTPRDENKTKLGADAKRTLLSLRIRPRNDTLRTELVTEREDE